MDWLKENAAKRVYHYKAEDGSEISGNLSNIGQEIGLTLTGSPGEQFVYKDVTYTRAGFDATPLNMATKVFFEKNGRKAYKIGNSYTSATKENYMKTGDTNTVLSSSYKKHMNDKIDSQMDYLAKDQKRFEKTKMKGSVSFAKAPKPKKGSV